MRTFFSFLSLSVVVSAAVACSPHVIGGSGASDTGGVGTGSVGTGNVGTGGTSTGTCTGELIACPQNTACVNGVEFTGQTACVDGQWECVKEPCNTSCNGATFEYCDGSTIATGCCPAGDPCASPPAFCDLGNGACVQGACPTYPDGGACTQSISATSYDTSCTTDADCVAVYQGTLCGCLCPNATINQDDAAAYNAAIAAAEPNPPDCFCPSSDVPACINGMCVLAGGL